MPAAGSSLPRPWASGRALNHNGSNTTWYASVWIAPARNFAILVATNQAGPAAEAACEETVSALIRYALNLGQPRFNEG